MKKTALFPAVLMLTMAGCVVNPDADKALRDEWRKNDSTAAPDDAVIPVAPDTGQHAMPVAPVPAAPTEMPVVNPVDTARAVPK